MNRAIAALAVNAALFRRTSTLVSLCSLDCSVRCVPHVNMGLTLVPSPPRLSIPVTMQLDLPLFLPLSPVSPPICLFCRFYFPCSEPCRGSTSSINIKARTRIRTAPTPAPIYTSGVTAYAIHAMPHDIGMRIEGERGCRVQRLVLKGVA